MTELPQDVRRAFLRDFTLVYAHQICFQFGLFFFFFGHSFGFGCGRQTLGNLCSSLKVHHCLKDQCLQRGRRRKAALSSKSALCFLSVLLILHLITLWPYWLGLNIAASDINERVSSVKDNMCSSLLSVQLIDDFQETIPTNAISSCFNNCGRTAQRWRILTRFPNS